MSTLKTHNLQSPDAGSVNIALTANAGMIVTGISTFNNRIDIGSLGVTTNFTVAGVSTFTGELVCGVISVQNSINIPDKLIHSGDANTCVRFPAVDTFAVETSGSERLRIDSNGQITHTNFSGVGFIMSGAGDPTFQISDTDGTNQFVQLAHNGGDSYIVTRNNTSHGEFLLYSQNGSETLNRFKLHSNGDISCGGAADNNIYNDTSGGGINFKNGGQLVISKQASSGADPLVWLNDTGQTTNKFLLFAQDGTEKASIGLAGNDLRFARDGYNETMRITSAGALMIGKTTSFGTVPLQVVGASSGLSDGGQIFDIGTANGSAGTRLAFGVNEDNFSWIRSYESGVGGRDLVFAASAEKMRISSSYAKIGINTSTFDTNGSQIKIEGRGTGTTTPAMLQIKGVGNGVLHSYVDLIATSDNNASGGYRGLGVVMLDEPTNVEWFSGRPYASADAYIIGRKASPSYRTQAGEAANQFFRIYSNGQVTQDAQSSVMARPPGNYSIPGSNGLVAGTWTTNTTGCHNIGSDFNTTGGIYTAPITGRYLVQWNVFLTNNTTRRDAFVQLNGTDVIREEIGDPEGTTGNNKNVSVQGVISMSVNDVLRFGALTTGGSTIYSGVTPWSYCCVRLLG